MLFVPQVNFCAPVTLNIGLGSSIALGKYKHLNLEPSPQRTLVDVCDAPYKVAEYLEQLRKVLDTTDFIYQVHDNGTAEGTLVVHLPNTNIRNVLGEAFMLSEALGQDCIAVWVHNPVNGGTGSLIGRYHYVWGEFDNQFFIHLN